MRIWIINIGEPLPLEKTFRLMRYGHLTREFAKRGHKVTWWGSTFDHATKKQLRPHSTTEVHEGVTLKILKGPGYRKNISLARLHHQKKFALSFYKEASLIEKPDIIVTTVPALEISESVTRYGLERKIPVLADVRDEWPDELKEIAPKPLQPLARVLLWNQYRQAYYVFKNATGIIGISKQKLQYGLSFAGRAQGWADAVLPLGYPVIKSELQDLVEAEAFWRKLGLKPDAFISCYIGNLGNACDMLTVIKAAKNLASHGNFQFVIAGGGDKLDYFRRASEAHPNIFFPGRINSPQIQALMKLCKVGIAPYRVGARMSLPNKPFEYLSGGLVVLSSLQGELVDILAENQAGFSYRADSAEQLEGYLKTLYSNPGLTVQMGNNSRKLFEARFTTQKIAEQMLNHLLLVNQKYGKVRSTPISFPTELAASPSL